MSQPPDVEVTQQAPAPVSILKKSRLTEAVNTSIRKSVAISEKIEQAATEKQGLMSNVSSEPNSEDRDLGLKPRDMENDAQGTQSSVGDRERRKWVNKSIEMTKPFPPNIQSHTCLFVSTVCSYKPIYQFS